MALTLARNVDVDQLEHFAPILDRHAAHDPTLEFGDQDFLGADVIRLTPGGRKPVDIREEGIRTHRPEPDIFVLIHRGACDFDDCGNVSPIRGADLDARVGTGHGDG